MAAPTIAQAPRPLTAEQADVLLQRQVKKHDVAIMLLHWFNAMVWMLELTTGVAMLTSSFRVAPWWYVQIVNGVFHSRANMLQFHIAVGITWIVVFLAYGIFGFRTYLTKEVIQRETNLDRDDLQWLRIRALGLIGRSKEPLPPQGIYNAGQKLFAVMVYAMVPLVMITGLVMTFHLIGTAAVGWAAAIHFAAVGLVLSGLMIHIYMGAIFPEEKPAFFSMLTGSVNELYAYSHHFKWWKQVSRVRDAIVPETRSKSAAPCPECAPQKQEIHVEGDKQP